MKKIIVGALMFLGMGATQAVAQDFLEDPRYGATRKEREANVASLNWLKDEYAAKNWAAVANYVRHLMDVAPQSSMTIYQYGANAYRNKIAKATSVAEKKMLIDSLMLIYDRRAEYFGNHRTQGTVYIKGLKAQDYLTLNPLDGAGVRRLYKEALDAAGDGADPKLVLTYFQQLVNGYKALELTPEELLGSYEQLAPMMDGAPEEDKESFTGLFATSGAADCKVLEDLYARELAEKPGDADVLRKAYNLMSMAKCDSDFYISVAEQHYAAEPSSGVAINLALIFEKKEQYDKAITYLNEQIAAENDPAAKSNIYLRIAASELGKKSYSAAAQAARQAISLNSANGAAHMLLGQAYLGGAAACSGFNRQTVYWLAYDQFARAREALEGDNSGLLESVNSSMAACRGNFPSNEDIFMYNYSIGASYNVNCGWVSGSTTVRAR